jgi:formylglycine-generating enzyme required for sulfatase activity
VATASDFIKDRSRTPFNIGHEIELKDFDEDALYAFKEVLGSGCEHLVDRIFYWTAGQPLMVQKLAEAVYRTLPPQRSPERVDRIVQETFLDTQVEKDTHFKFIRDYLLEGNPKVRQTLKTYQAVLRGEDVPYDDRSATHARLRLAGVVALDGKRLVPRNRIYQQIFDAAWVADNMPRNIAKIVAITSSAALVLVLLWFLALQPILVPKFAPLQQTPWGKADIHYTDDRTFQFDLSLPRMDITKITLNGEKLSWTPSGAERSVIWPENLRIEISNLEIGVNAHLLRIYGRPWQKNFETNLSVVSYPKSRWRVPQGLEMVEIPAGCFEMGCVYDIHGCILDEKPVRRVCLEAFEIGRYEVTQEQWIAIMGNNPSYFKNGEGQRPVEMVGWNEVREFLRRLNELTGKKFRLPTEAEWEYAARSLGKNMTYAGGENLDELGWYSENSDGQTHTVGQKNPNKLGIFDMSGNVWEWVEDDYHNSYNEAPVDGQGWIDDPRGALRVMRGGSWNNGGHYCRLLARRFYAPTNRHNDIGFRLARSVTLGP